MAPRYRIPTERHFEIHDLRSRLHCLDWSLDNVLAIGTADGMIRLASSFSSDVPIPTTELSEKCHSAPVEQLGWHKSRPEILASASSDKTVALWDIGTKKCLSSVGSSGENINMCWISEHVLVVGDKRDCISVIDWRTSTITAQKRFPFEVNEMVGVGWTSTDDEFKAENLMMALGDGSIGRGKVTELIEIEENLSGHCSNCYAVDSVGEWLVAGAADAMVSVWKHVSGAWQCKHCLCELQWPVRAVALMPPSGCIVAAGSEDPAINLWDTASGRLLASITSHPSEDNPSVKPGPVNALAWSNPRPMSASDEFVRSWMLAWSTDDLDSRTDRSLPGVVRVAVVEEYHR